MKTIKSIITLFILTLALTTVSCDNEPVDPDLNLSNGGGGGSSTYYVKVKIDGVQKTWTTFSSQYNSTAFILIAPDPSGSLGLTVGLPTGVNNYPLEEISVNCRYILSGDNFFSSDYSNDTTSPGSINITELNTTARTIKGTFNFIGKNQDMSQTKTFTNGEFYLPYQ